LKLFGSTLLLAATVSVAAQQPSVTPTLGERAVATVLHQNIINPTVHVDGTKASLSSQGKWSIAKTPPEGCAPSTSCVKTIYTVADSNVTCQWVVQLSNQDTADGVIVDEDENAEKYLLHILKPDEAKALISNSVQAIYPAIAMAAHVSGIVEISWVIQADGKPDIRLISGPPMLQGAAKAAAEQWTFAPLLIHGRAIPWTNYLVFDFITTGIPSGTVTSHFATKKPSKHQ
jgi:outer membrane biosynthesis protein TonB